MRGSRYLTGLVVLGVLGAGTPALAAVTPDGGTAATPLPVPQATAARATQAVGVYTAPAVVSQPPSTPSAPAPPAAATERYTVTSHHLLQSDGSWDARLYAAPEFHQEDGVWSAIDARVSAGTVVAGIPFAAPHGLHPLSFGAGAQSLMQFTLPRGVVTVTAGGLKLAVPTLDATTNTLTFAAVATTTDLAVKPNNAGVSQQIVLRSALSPHSFTFHISDPAGALGSVSPMPGGEYQFSGTDEYGLHLTIPAAFAYAQATPDLVDPGSAHEAVTAAGDGFDVTGSVDATWLAGRPTRWCWTRTTRSSRVAPARPACWVRAPATCAQWTICRSVGSTTVGAVRCYGSTLPVCHRTQRSATPRSGFTSRHTNTPLPARCGSGVMR